MNASWIPGLDFSTHATVGKACLQLPVPELAREIRRVRAAPAISCTPLLAPEPEKHALAGMQGGVCSDPGRARVVAA